MNENSLKNLEKRVKLEPNTERTELIRKKALEKRQENSSIRKTVKKILLKEHYRMHSDDEFKLVHEKVTHMYEVAEALVNKAKLGDLKAIEMILKINGELEETYTDDDLTSGTDFTSETETETDEQDQD